MLDQIEVGDIIEVKNGEKASVDGKSIVELSTFDESSLTGESYPIEKQKGDRVYSGTINTGIVMRYEATKNYANSTLSMMMNLLEDSLASKPKIEETTNKLSKHFSLTIILLALLTFIGWYSYSGDFETTLIVTISVVVIACPCALALATPIASLVGISWATEKGLLFKEAKFIETFAKATTVVLDKTGTITKGELTVTSQSQALDPDSLALLFALVDSSTHPVSRAIKCYLLEQYEEIASFELQNIAQLSSRGIHADYQGQSVLGGNAKLMAEQGIQVQQSSATVFHFVVEGELLVTFELEDTLKEGIKALVDYCQKHEIEMMMATGDNEQVANAIAKEAGIEKVYAELLPTDKSNLIQSLKEQGNTVVMVGDGVNDTLALSHADIAIAMGSGADVALSISDVVILNNALTGVRDALNISRRTYKFIKQNLLISLLYNILTVPLAIAGYVMPLIAALSMSLSSLLVVGNSMRIKNEKL